MRAYLDTSALIQLCEQGEENERIRQGFTQSKARGIQNLLVISPATVEEMLGAHRAPAQKRLGAMEELGRRVEFLEACLNAHSLMMTEDLSACTKADAWNRLALERPSTIRRGLNWLGNQASYQTIMQPQREFARMKSDWRARDFEDHRHIVRLAGGEDRLKDRTCTAGGIRVELSRAIGKRVDDVMRERARRWNLPRRKRWGQPEAPTQWALIAYLYARMVLLHEEGQSLTGTKKQIARFENDMVDRMHLGFSAHARADVFVTCDGRERQPGEMLGTRVSLLDIAGACPGYRPRPILFDAWVREQAGLG